MSIQEKIINWLDIKFTRTDGKKDYCTASPDVVFGVDIGENCCKYHDQDYYLKKITRKEADLKLKNNIQKAFNSDDKKIRGFFISWMYYIGVRLFGGNNY